GLGLSLTDALLLVRVAEPESIVLQHPHRHAHGARAAAQDVSACDDLRQVLAHRFTDLLVVTQPVARASREEVIPARLAGARTRCGPARRVFAHDCFEPPDLLLG